MDHSIHGYLRRRTTEELELFLSQHQEEYRQDLDENVIEMIMEILEERKKEEC